MRTLLASLVTACFACVAHCDEIESRYRDQVLPVLSTYCFDCHSDGAAEGGMSFDSFSSDRALVRDRALWWSVLKNLRAGIMPPRDELRPSPKEQQRVTDWIKTAAFGVDPANPDPGRVTVRRLNRAEYRNTIGDLMGIDFNAEVVFPPDDTGFGFDNMGDALSLSPLLMEKFVQSARAIVKEAVPSVCKVIPAQKLTGKDFRSHDDADINGSLMDYSQQATVRKTVPITLAGRYRLSLEVRLHGSFDFDPSRCRVTFSADGQELYQDEYAWDERKSVHYQFEQQWAPGDHELTFQLDPIEIPEKESDEDGGGLRSSTYVRFHILHVDVEGPLDSELRVHPANYERFFTRDEPPVTAEEQREYAREVLKAFTLRAFRRPADDQTLERLVDIAEVNYRDPEKTFETGVAQAIVAVLASPRFLFRLEDIEQDNHDPFPLIDQYSLASRLSYFFWSTMPDEELMELAERGELRASLSQQVERMLQDDRSSEFVKNFVGQWLRARDVEHVSLDPLVALGYGEEYEQLRSVFRRRFRAREGEEAVSDEEWERTRSRFRELRDIQDKFDGDARRAMRRETEMVFDYIVREDRSVLDLIDSDYTFVNAKLADLYDLPGIEGDHMRRVTLPAGSARGGVLTQGTMLTVTSNPTRTSPVKRGLFILDNILGTPAPPAPANVPELEEAAKNLEGREPTLREVLAAHREAPLCSSCHSRMDPLGIALENFNALGMWRDSEQDQPIDASGQLITGESFSDVRELKKILAAEHRFDFYRCLTQKLLTYALGRGIEHYDEYTVDRIVDRLDQAEGRFGVLLHEVLNSPSFQRQRRANPPTTGTLNTSFRENEP